MKVLSISDAFKRTIMKHITSKPKKIAELYGGFFKTQRRNLTDKVFKFFFFNTEVRKYLRSPLLSSILNINNVLRNTTLFTLNNSPVPLLRNESKRKTDFELSKLKS